MALDPILHGGKRPRSLDEVLTERARERLRRMLLASEAADRAADPEGYELQRLLRATRAAVERAGR